MTTTDDLLGRFKGRDKHTAGKLLAKAKAASHENQYTRRWLYDYLTEKFKDWSTDSGHNVLDLCELCVDVGAWANVSRREVRRDVSQYLRENVRVADEDYAKKLFDEAQQIRRLHTFLQRWKMTVPHWLKLRMSTIAEIRHALEEADDD